MLCPYSTVVEQLTQKPKFKGSDLAQKEKIWEKYVVFTDQSSKFLYLASKYNTRLNGLYAEHTIPYRPNHFKLQ